MHLRSPAARARRHERAVARDYVIAAPVNCSHVLVHSEVDITTGEKVTLEEVTALIHDKFAALRKDFLVLLADELDRRMLQSEDKLSSQQMVHTPSTNADSTASPMTESISSLEEDAPVRVPPPPPSLLRCNPETKYDGEEQDDDFHFYDCDEEAHAAVGEVSNEFDAGSSIEALNEFSDLADADDVHAGAAPAGTLSIAFAGADVIKESSTQGEQELRPLKSERRKVTFAGATECCEDVSHTSSHLSGYPTGRRIRHIRFLRPC